MKSYSLFADTTTFVLFQARATLPVSPRLVLDAGPLPSLACMHIVFQGHKHRSYYGGKAQNTPLPGLPLACCVVTKTDIVVLCAANRTRDMPAILLGGFFRFPCSSTANHSKSSLGKCLHSMRKYDTVCIACLLQNQFSEPRIVALSVLRPKPPAFIALH